MSNMDMNQVNAHLDEIIEKYTEVSYWKRLRKMFVGLKAPRKSREYKEAMIEVQRLSAPISAILLPLAAIGLLMLMTTGTGGMDVVIETEIIDAEEIQDLDKIDELEERPDVIQDVSLDVPVDSPEVQVDQVTNQPMSPQPQTFDAVMSVRSPVILRNIFGSMRNTGTRGAQLAQFGGDKHTEAAVLRALRWLKKNQLPDGSWNRNKIAMTGLAVLTFLAHGELPGQSVEFGPTIQRALEYLMRVQNKQTGLLPGAGTNYDHPIAAYALCEAYGMTLNPNVKVAAELSLLPIIKGQNPTGGWTYNMNPAPDPETGKCRNDSSYMAWCVQALKAGQLAGLRVDGLEQAMKQALRGFRLNAHPNGGFGYTSPSATSGLTALGVLSFQLLGAGNDRLVRLSFNNVIDNWTPSFEPKGPMGSSLQYYFYYATQAIFHEGGKRWENWNRRMKEVYVKAQRIERNAIQDPQGRYVDIGWWENSDQFTDRPVMDTCLAALQLMVYYRYLPTTSKEAVLVEAEIMATSIDPGGDIRVDTGNL